MHVNLTIASRSGEPPIANAGPGAAGIASAVPSGIRSRTSDTMPLRTLWAAATSALSSLAAFANRAATPGPNTGSCSSIHAPCVCHASQACRVA
jgi:hypothetical protein